MEMAEISLNISKKELSQTKKSVILIESIRAMTGDGFRTRMDLLDYIMILPEKQYTSLMKFMKIRNQMSGLQKKLNGVATMITQSQVIVQNLSQ